jgi:hypothetical protein
MRTSRSAVLAVLAAALVVVASPAVATAAAPPADDAVVLPSRVGNAINRAQILLDAASLAIDTHDSTKAVAALQAISAGVTRADKAARVQMDAVAAPDSETTPGPDSVVAVLTLDQTVVTSLAGLFDGQTGAIVDAATHSLFATMNTRDKLLATVIALPAEGAGADYSDGMADIVTGFDDEAANLTEALANDKLSAGGRKVLTAALAQSQRAQAAAAAAFGGGE